MQKVIERFSTTSKGEKNIHWNLIKFYDFLIQFSYANFPFSTTLDIYRFKTL